MASKAFLDTKAPDFRLDDTNGQPVALSDYAGKLVHVVFNRGFF